MTVNSVNNTRSCL